MAVLLLDLDAISRICGLVGPPVGRSRARLRKRPVFAAGLLGDTVVSLAGRSSVFTLRERLAFAGCVSLYASSTLRVDVSRGLTLVDSTCIARAFRLKHNTAGNHRVHTERRWTEFTNGAVLPPPGDA